MIAVKQLVERNSVQLGVEWAWSRYRIAVAGSALLVAPNRRRGRGQTCDLRGAGRC
jgi:hypothetical protein